MYERTTSQVVVFIGTCATDSYAAQYICKSNTLECLIDLLKAKQEDDEIVLQVVYVFHQLVAHPETRKYVVQDTDAVAYIIDLMHDKNTEVQRVCDRTLDIISQYDDSWSERVQVSAATNAQGFLCTFSARANDHTVYQFTIEDPL